jgi:hypothetical protein
MSFAWDIAYASQKTIVHAQVESATICPIDSSTYPLLLLLLTLRSETKTEILANGTPYPIITMFSDHTSE